MGCLMYISQKGRDGRLDLPTHGRSIGTRDGGEIALGRKGKQPSDLTPYGYLRWS